MNIKKDDNVFDDDCGAFRAQTATTRSCVSKSCFPSGSRLCNPPAQRNIANSDTVAITPLYPDRPLLDSNYTTLWDTIHSS